MNCKIVMKSFLCAGASFLLLSCGPKEQADPAAEAPPAAKVVEQQDVNVIDVEHPDRFALATATAAKRQPTLTVNGSIAPDVARTVPVISLASGRVVEIKARLGDSVKQGQILLRIQSNDIASAFSDYQNAVADERLSRTQLDRAKTLYEKGAVAHRDLEVAEDAETKAQVLVHTTLEHLHVLGVSPDHPTTIVDVAAPVSGVIIEQNVTASGGVKTLDNSPSLFTIADLSRVWILCDVYENDLSAVKLGEIADVRLSAYPDQVFHARISNIGQILDPATRTAKVRLDVANPGMMKAGMFATATFFGRRAETVTVVPASAVLHLHDRDWVYLPTADKKFRRAEVSAGGMEGGSMQVVKAGLSPGQQVVVNALQLSSEAQQ
jgi:cobalt-zinc-cadmium efflux system membrane fusion protein